MADLTIANSVVNLIQGDIQEHLPMTHIPLAGDVLGLGTTTSIDNGELTFLQNRDNTSAIWRCIAHDGSTCAFHLAMEAATFLTSVSPRMPRLCGDLSS